MAVELLSQLTMGTLDYHAGCGEGRISLDAQLVAHPADTFYFRQDNDSMIGANIPPGAVLLVDRLAPKKHGCIVIAVVEQEFVCRRFARRGLRNVLLAENPKYNPIGLDDFTPIEIFGVVQQIITDSRFV